ncbi:hypothetical protein LSTR_LSTR015385 [Laodelphax striatellus]|uniref:Uncharacterized protein n=1 Tax=Laodelphax striatellus TaxID=195883 RepID=A0A482WP96_LAOST|nr:hypothetical protein LSTR_LSTR015385 [Laodelphax striatellus]
MKTSSTGDYMVQLLSIIFLSLLNINWVLGEVGYNPLGLVGTGRPWSLWYGPPGSEDSVACQDNARTSRALELLPPKSPILGPLTKTLILSTASETTYQPGAAKNVPEAPYLYYRPPSPYRSSEPFDRSVPSRHTSDYVLVPYSVPGSISSEPLNAPPGTVVIL